MIRIVFMCVTTFIVYVLYTNLDWTDFEGIVVIVLTIGIFIMNELRILGNKLKHKEDTDAN